MRSATVPETIRTRGGAKIVNTVKVAERYVKDNVDMSQVARDDETYIRKMCAEIKKFVKRSDLYFKVVDDTTHYTIQVANWNDYIIFTEIVETFHMDDSPELYHNIISSKGNFVTRQVEFMVKKRGIVTTMKARHDKALEAPYARSNRSRVPPPPNYTKRATRHPQTRVIDDPIAIHSRGRNGGRGRGRNRRDRAPHEGRGNRHGRNT